MGPGQYVASGIFTLAFLQTCLLSGRPRSDFVDGHEVQEGRKCDHTFSMKIFKGGNTSLFLPITTKNMISVSHYDFQKHNETELLISFKNNHYKLGNKTEVSLVNHTFTLQKVKKSDEGLYQIKEYKEERCLAQINVTVFDSPSSPGATNLPNGGISVTPTLFPLEDNNTVVDVPVIVSVVILAFIILCFLIFWAVYHHSLL